MTAVREHLGLPSINKPNTDMAATFRSDLPMRNIDADKLRGSSPSNARVASPNLSASGSKRKEAAASGGVLSPTGFGQGRDGLGG